MKYYIEFFKVLEALGKEYIETRFIQTDYKTVSGVFKTDEEGAKALDAEVKRLSLEKFSMYHTINKLLPEYVENCIADGKLNTLCKYANSTTKDSDIAEIKLIMLDFDPIRKAGVSATDEEKNKARELMEQVVSDLSSEGLGNPAYITDSGNGFNAYYPVAFANDKKHNQIVADFIGAVSKKYSNEFVDIDLTTKNPSRIAKVPGSWSAKGENTVERPHRQCQLIESNVSQVTLTAEQIQSYIKSQQSSDNSSGKADKDSKKKTRRISDVIGWLDNYKIKYRAEQKEYDGKPCTMYLLKECPFDSHDNEYCSFLMQGADMKVSFKCHHNHCTQDIHDFISKYPLPKQPPVIDGDKDYILVYNEIIANSELILDTNNKKAKYIRIDKNVYEFESAECCEAIRKKALTSVGVLLSPNGIKTVHSNISSLFNDYAAEKEVFKRCYFKGSDYYYAVKPDKFLHIKDGKAEYTDSCLAYLVYNPGFINQIEPDLTSPASDLPMLADKVFNITEQDKRRFLAQLCAFFIPELVAPFLSLSGGHGTSKTTTARKIIQLVEPKNVDIVSVPEKEDGLIAALSGSYITAFDNIDKISTSYSDCLCVACTGGYAIKRALYTNNTKAEVYLKSHVILNGIGDFVSRSDLAERCNTIYLDAIQKRLTEKQVWNEFEALKPKILGSIFNTIASALQILPDMEKSVVNLPRMADFAQYGAAFVKAMGLSTEAFVRDYSDANSQLIADCCCSEPFISAVINFVNKNSGKWTGKATELLEALRSSSPSTHAVLANLSPSSFSRKLNQSIADLNASGVEVNIRTTTPKSITLTDIGCSNNE